MNIIVLKTSFFGPIATLQVWNQTMGNNAFLGLISFCFWCMSFVNSNGYFFEHAGKPKVNQVSAAHNLACPLANSITPL